MSAAVDIWAISSCFKPRAFDNKCSSVKAPG